MNTMQAMYVVCIRLTVGEEESSCSGDNTSSADFVCVMVPDGFRD
jgi:hypothetical protein